MWPKIDAIFARHAEKTHAPGLAAGVVRNGQLEHLVTLGVADLAEGRPVTGDTAFRIASMTKNVTALAILMLRDAGVLRLDAPIGDYVPEMRALALPTADSAPVTVRHLLTHTAGFVTDDPWADRVLGITPGDFTALLTAGQLFARPSGVAFEYSNLGYGILGRAISNLSGRPYQAVVHDILFAPLGLTATTFDPAAAPRATRATGYWWREGEWGEEPYAADGEFGAMGGLITTANDYARYVAFLLDAWPARDGAETGPARRATRRELALFHAMPDAPTVRPSGRDAGDEGLATATAYGYGLASSADPQLGRYVHHSGGLPGFGSNVLFSPDAGVGIFAFANVTYASPMSANAEAAAVLETQGAWRPRETPISPALQAAADAAADAYAAGRLDGMQGRFALNLLPDAPLAARNAILAGLRAQFGEGRLDRIDARHALAGRLHLVCQRGAVTCQIALTPGPRPRIQTLRFDAA